MVEIAVAGGSGQVAQEIIDVLLASNKHNITVLSRKPSPETPIALGLRWKCVDYNYKQNLAEALTGIHTVLSFIQLLSDPEQMAQKNLIDAAVSAGVKRFAPSEYGSKDTVDMPWWNGKRVIREYLKEVNAKQKVLECTLFQPGLFINYLAYPHKTTKHLSPLQSVFDFEHCRAIMVEGHENAVMTLTTVTDLAEIIALAVEDELPWPTVGGIQGNRLTFSEIVGIGERVRGRPFAVEKVKIEDLQAGRLETSWKLSAVHSAVSEDQASAMLKAVSIGILLSATKGAWDSSKEMNGIFPTHEFTTAEEFLTRIWEGKP